MASTPATMRGHPGVPDGETLLWSEYGLMENTATRYATSLTWVDPVLSLTFPLRAKLKQEQQRRRLADGNKDKKKKSHILSCFYGVSAGPQRIWAWDTFIDQPVGTRTTTHALDITTHALYCIGRASFALKTLSRNLSYKVHTSGRCRDYSIRIRIVRETSLSLHGVNDCEAGVMQTTGRPCKIFEASRTRNKSWITCGHSTINYTVSANQYKQL
jgi:hypothetical protein